MELLSKLHARGYQLLVISPDPVSFEARGLGENPSVKLAARIARLQREVLLRKLRHRGVQVVNWDVSQPFEQAVRSSLSRPAAFLHAIQRGRSAGGR